MRVGFVTIGQSPRVDVFNDIKHLLPKDIEIVEKGALDNYTEEEINKKLKPRKNETTYITKLKNGKEVKISKNKVVKLLKDVIKELNKEGVDLIVILCTGSFPRFASEVPVIYPYKLLEGFVSALNPRVLGVLAPAQEQINYLTRRWLKKCPKVVVEAISPYTSDLKDFLNVGKRLAEEGVKVVVMDCIGYSISQAQVIKASLGEDSLVLNPRLALVTFIRALTFFSS
ncbi:MAG: hypothetical protein B7O98_01055 [Zestosphaera tikiterensis]|uniref:AroM family protein n=1 Tax=Zestosphaera tikiterensis TaxID=1973259 RepID=A0A2R7Y923_9CREN|nr:MAG: hypothetical protein B7O98_01055 [Zestosphaera tikiterensis]